MHTVIDTPARLDIIPAIGRSLEDQKRYNSHLLAKHQRGDVSCDLCNAVERVTSSPETAVSIGGAAVRLSDKRFALIENDFPYNNYDGHEVLAHHMLIPTVHIDYDTLMRDPEWRHAEADAKAELFDAAPGYYHTYMGRTALSAASSIPGHAHAHLFHLGRTITEQTFSIPSGRNDLHFSTKV